jgi:hypothetical protein
VKIHGSLWDKDFRELNVYHGGFVMADPKVEKAKEKPKEAKKTTKKKKRGLDSDCSLEIFGTLIDALCDQK